MVERLSRLVSLVDQGFIAGWEEMARVDIRYERGLSVDWVDSEWEEDMESLVPLSISEYNTMNSKRDISFRSTFNG